MSKLKINNGEIAHEGDRVYCYDIDKNGKPVRAYGTLREDTNWLVDYDDGETFVVLDPETIYPARQ